MVASDKKDSNIILAFLLPHRKERIYSVILKSTEGTDTLCFPELFIHTETLGKQCLSIPDSTDFSFTHNASIGLSEKLLIG